VDPGYRPRFAPIRRTVLKRCSAALFAWAILTGGTSAAPTGDPPAAADAAGGAAGGAARGAAPLRLFLRGGPKTHGPGEHDHPRWVAEWKELLAARGAQVAGELRFPTADELARTDVLVMYAAEGGSIHGEERAALEAFLARGGGVVALHDSVCGDDPHWWKTVIGGAWEHGHAKWHTDTIDLYYADRDHPVSAGCGNFRFRDEIYHQLHFVDGVEVLASSFHTVFDIAPQAWTFAGPSHRAFVSLQGHFHDSFAHPSWRGFVLRGIAWAGRREIDLLTTPEERSSLAYPPGGPTAPEKAHEQLVLHPEFELDLVAAEPLIAKPISIEWDARGRAIVALTPGYPEKAQFSGIAPHDEIAILVDADGDGRAEAKKTFCGGLDLVTSVVPWRDGVIVSAAPEILWLRDRNGDDACDERVVLFKGFGFGDTHATISNLRFGLDGWIYGTQGYSGGASRHIVGVDGKDHGHIGNGLFRFRPDGSAIEMVSAYGSNTWGLDWTDDDELFFTMANGAHLRHVVLPEAVLRGGRVGGVESFSEVPDHDRVFPLSRETVPAYVQIDFVGGFTAAAGCLIYTGGAWPETWRNAHFVTEPTVNLVHHDALGEQGVTYRGSKAREAEFLASPDVWFRPVHLRAGPDGAAWLLDFYNQAVVHNDTRGPPHGPTNAARRPDRDHHHGRIWRIQHRDAKPVAMPPLAGAHGAALVAALDHQNRLVRATALRLLIEQGAGAQGDALRQQSLTGTSAAGRLAAAWGVQHADRVDAAIVGRWLADPDDGVRKAAARIGALQAGDPEAPAVVSALASALPKASPRLRLELLAAIGTVAPSALELGQEVREACLAAWDGAGDDWTRTALVRALANDAAGLLAGAARGGSIKADLLAHVVTRSVRADPDRSPRLLEPLAALSKRDPAAARAAVESFLRALPSELRPPLPAASEGALKTLLGGTDVELALATLPLAVRLDPAGKLAPAMTGLADRLDRTLKDEAAPGTARVGALEALLSISARRDGAIAAAEPLLAPTAPLDLQLAAIEAFGSTDHVAAAKLLAGTWNSLSEQPRDRIFDLLVARPTWTAVLLDQLAARPAVARELGPQRLHRLRNHPEASLAERATALLAKAIPATDATMDALIARMMPEVDQPGDAANGKVVFEANCAKCHTAYGAGGKVGPDLTGMGMHGAHDLLPVILDPNRVIEGSYTEWQAHLKDGRLETGVLVRETSESVVLRNAEGDREFARGELAKLKNSGRSPMPAGFESLGAAALRDVIAFLAGGSQGWRVLDLRAHATADARSGLYDTKRDHNPLRLRQYGIVTVEGVPFELLDSRRTVSRKNAVVLKGGLVDGWESKEMPQRIALPVGSEVAALHVLGGIAAWGWPYFREVEPVLSLTWRYANGSSAETVLQNGVEFADWIGPNEVPGSKYVPGMVADGSAGQVRYHAHAPPKAGRIASIELSSFDNRYAPTLLALTVELPGAKKAATAPVQVAPRDVVIFGGGSSHDFVRHWGETDVETLAGAGVTSVVYHGEEESLAAALPAAKRLVLANNQPIRSTELRAAIRRFVEQGGTLLVLHAACWFNWPEWPEWNAELVAGGARSHEAYGEFDVELDVPQDAPAVARALTEGVAAKFSVTDELYRFEPDAAVAVTPLLHGRSRVSKDHFAVAFTHPVGKGRVIVCTLGHDEAAHAHPDYQRFLVNALR
jgi:putative membrane-bound dehydrogenase-like protein